MCRADGQMSAHLVAKDSSGNGNDLPLVSPPLHFDADIKKVRLTLPGSHAVCTISRII